MTGVFKLLISLPLMGAIIQLAGPAWSEPAPAPFRTINDPAVTEPEMTATLTARSATDARDIRVPDAQWLQVRFQDWRLPEGSSITITDVEGGEEQTFTQETLDAWNGRSAIFDSTHLRITADLPEAAGEEAFYTINEIVVGEIAPEERPEILPGGEESAGAEESLCGDDNRVASTDARIGRIMPIGCTGWIVGSNTMLTAGHCIAATTDILQFNVPPSEPNTTPNNPGVVDQYAIDAGSIAFFNDGPGQIGNDWAVFRVAPNTQTGLLPFQAQGGRLRMTNDASPGTVRLTGYGLDTGTTNQTQQTDAGNFLGSDVQGANDVVIEYQADTRGGNSGGPVIIDPQNSVAIGIHTNAGCAPPSAGNTGTGFQHEQLWNTIATFDPSHDIVWQRRDGQVHYWPLHEGARIAGLNVFSPVSAQWTLVGVGDLTGDGTDDIVWQRRDGQVHYWPMLNGERQGGQNLHTPVSAQWTVRGLGDVDGNGTADVVWQRRDGQVHYWPMTEGTRTGGINIHSPVGAEWTLVGVGDVTGDGTDDIVWQRRDGQVHFWPMQNGQRQGGVNVHTPVSAQWKIRGIGDVDGDGTDDVVWQRRDGQVHFWPMQSGVRTGGINIHSPVGPNWTLAGVGDVD